MQLYELKQELKAGHVRPVYIFNGVETGIKDIYVKQIAAVCNTSPSKAETFLELKDNMYTTSLLQDRVVYVITDDKDFAESQTNQQKAASYAGPHVLIFCFTGLRKNSKLLTANEEICVNFDRLLPDQLGKYATKKIGLTASLSKILAEICDCDYTRVMLEIDKIKDHSDVSGLNIDESFKKCVDSGLIFQDAKDVVFELVNQVMLNNKAKAFELLKEFNEFTDSHLGFLALLYSNFRQLLLVQGLGDKNNIAERTGLTGFQVRMALNRFGSYRLQEIMEALKMLQFMDKAIKTGIVEPKRAGELILCLVMR